ncbi:acylphosphatase [Geoalkalibacter sp.]|uniref:acylphosphatase n=1 Tax=Geoalkalibacter sp. TaxID=3041440 RepID=UPI00272E222F|nr:acylphosphatase [Geoalkalibacter sp.]
MRRVRAQVRIEGQVQGVSFRYHTRDRARNLGLHGWVKNLADGAVAAVFEGEESSVRAMLDWCRQGPAAARVDKVAVALEEARGEFHSFEIVF